MEMDKKEWEKKAKCVYVPPKIEMHAAEPSRPFATSPVDGDHLQGLDGAGDGFGDHLRGFSAIGFNPNPPRQEGFSGSHDRGTDGETGGGIHIRGNAAYW
jgi:hypothetical protein